MVRVKQKNQGEENSLLLAVWLGTSAGKWQETHGFLCFTKLIKHSWKKEVSHEFATEAINPLHSSGIHLAVTAC